MKANKALKRLSKIETRISEVAERYSAGDGDVKKLLEEAKQVVARVNAAVKKQQAAEVSGDQSVTLPEATAAARPKSNEVRPKAGPARRKGAAKSATAKSARVRGPARKLAMRAPGETSKEAASVQSAYW